MEGKTTIACVYIMDFFLRRVKRYLDRVVDFLERLYLGGSEEVWTFKYFKREEFTCNCGCGENNISEDLVEALDYIRELLGTPMKVTSGTRCVEWNKEVGGRPNSAHLTGHAADILCVSSALRFGIVSLAISQGITRIGFSREFIHLDIDETKASDVIWVH